MNKRVSAQTSRKDQLWAISQYLIALAIVSAVILHGPFLLSRYKNSLRTVHTVTDSRELTSLLQAEKLSLAPVNGTDTVKRIRSLNLPADLEDLSPSMRSEIFIGLVLSQAIRANEQILLQRRRIIRHILAEERGNKVVQSGQIWLSRLATHYGQPGISATQLLKYVDIVPTSLILAQAIIESGWGTSRFALQGNALFGQHLPATSSASHMASLRGGVKVATFENLFGSIKSYMHNLNTSGAYREFREIREQQRSAGNFPDGYSLADGLYHYSARGSAYIATIKEVIKSYNLLAYDRAVLDRTSPPVTFKFSRPQENPLPAPGQTGKMRANATTDTAADTYQGRALTTSGQQRNTTSSDD